IWNNISMFLDATYIFEFRRICKATSYTQVTNLYDLDYKIIKNLNNDIIKNYPYCEKLLVNIFCRIDNEGIKNLTNLIELYATNNNKITNINHMSNLQKLDAYGDCGIDDNGIKNLTNLIFLNASVNPKITNINHMRHLQTLYAFVKSGINDEGIKNLTNLIE